MPRIATLLLLLVAAAPAAAHDCHPCAPRARCATYTVTVCRPSYARYSYYRSHGRHHRHGRLWTPHRVMLHVDHEWFHGRGSRCDGDGLPPARTAPVGARFLLDSPR